jgi:sulfite exporter TauE/SafE
MAITGAGFGPASVGFHIMRLVSYAAAGAVVASSMGALAQLGQASAALRPVWTLVHAAALALGLWLLWRGRQPAWLENLGRQRSTAMATSAGTPVRWFGSSRPAWRSSLAGAAWVGWPCGLLQSALLTAAMSSSVAGGAVVMTAFGVASAAGLLAAPWLYGAAGGRRLSPAAAALTIRVAGGVLVAASAWALWRAASGQVFCHT